MIKLKEIFQLAVALKKFPILLEIEEARLKKSTDPNEDIVLANTIFEKKTLLETMTDPNLKNILSILLECAQVTLEKPNSFVQWNNVRSLNNTSLYKNESDLKIYDQFIQTALSFIKEKKSAPITNQPTSVINPSPAPEKKRPSFILPRASTNVVDELKNTLAKRSQSNLSTKEGQTPQATPSPIIKPNTPSINPKSKTDSKPVQDAKTNEALLNEIKNLKDQNTVLEEQLTAKQKKLDEQHKVLLLLNDNLKHEEALRRKFEVELDVIHNNKNIYLYNPETDGNINATEFDHLLKKYIHYLAQDKYYDSLYALTLKSLFHHYLMKGYVNFLFDEYKNLHNEILFNTEKNLSEHSSKKAFNEKLFEDLSIRYQDAIHPDPKKQHFKNEEREVHKLCANFFAVTMIRMESLKPDSTLNQLAKNHFSNFVKRNLNKINNEIEIANNLLNQTYSNKINLLDEKEIKPSQVSLFQPPPDNKNNSLTNTLTKQITSTLMWAVGQKTG